MSRHPGLCDGLDGPPEHQGDFCCDGGLQDGRGEGGTDHDLGRVGPPCKQGQNRLGNSDSGLQMVHEGSVDGEDPELEATYV